MSSPRMTFRTAPGRLSYSLPGSRPAVSASNALTGEPLAFTPEPGGLLFAADPGATYVEVVFGPVPPYVAPPLPESDGRTNS